VHLNSPKLLLIKEHFTLQVRINLRWWKHWWSNNGTWRN